MEDHESAAPRGHEPGNDELEIGARVGRYVVLGRLGAGGMGVVFAAHDPELDRRVALKLLREAGRDAAARHQRLLAEAQAMARLAHPNVVTVHDVGEHRGRVFLALELVDGETLAAWLTREHPLAERLRVLVDAGRGLAAAHARGLVHRDFKPENVMIDREGRVRVMDFGLAREVERGSTRAGDDTSVDASVDTSATATSALGAELTLTGALLGTPAYMAPEVFAGGPADARSDVFAFAVVLWEALYGERPFAGESLALLARNVLQDRRRSPPRGARVPTWLRAVVERGLAIDPARRWPTIDALQDALARGQRRARARRIAGLALALLALLALVVGGRGFARERASAACEDEAAAIDALWNDDARARVAEGLRATGLAYAPATVERALPWIDRAAAAWRGTRTELCVAAEVDATLDPELYARGLACLEDQRLSLDALVAELAGADAQIVQRAVAAAAALAEVGSCGDPRRLDRLPRPPEAEAAHLGERRRQLSRASTLLVAGKPADGLEVLDAIGEGDTWPPLEIATRLLRGRLLVAAGRYDEAEATLETTYFDAAADRLGEPQADAAIELATLVGYRQSRPADGARWARHAALAVDALGEGQALRRADLLNSEAMSRQAAGAAAEAIPRYLEAIELRGAALGPAHPRVANLRNNLAVAQRTTGAYDEAKTTLEAVLATLEASLGPTHPEVATILDNLAGVHMMLGEDAAAEALYRRALALREEVLGREHPIVAQSLTGLGLALRERGADGEARRALERALAILEAALGREHPDVAYTLTNLASLAVEPGSQAARTSAAQLERALAIFERALGPEHPYVALPLAGLADLALAEGRPGDALPLAERALALSRGDGLDPLVSARIRFIHARALAASGRDLEDAAAIVDAIVEELQGLGPGARRLRAAIDRWRAERAGGE